MSLSPVSMRRAGAVVIQAAALLALTACERMMPTAPEIENLDVRSVERYRWIGWFHRDSTLLYFVDGRRVSAEESRALPAANVASIRLTRSRDVTEQASLHVTTSPIVGVTKVLFECADHADCSDVPNPEGGPGEILPGAGAVVMQGQMNPRAVTRYAGLVIVDGQLVDVLTFMSRIDTRDIESLEILKGSTAEQLYAHPRAAYGVMRITTWMRDGICGTNLVQGNCPGRDAVRREP